MQEFDVVYAAYEGVLAVADAAPEVTHAEKRVHSRKEKEELTHVHEANTDLDVVVLDAF